MSSESANAGHQKQAQKRSLEQFMRDTFRNPLNAAASFLQRLGITANVMTVAGLGVNILAAVLIGFGYLTVGGLVLLIGAPMDALDGALARLSGSSTPFGAFLDSVTDRYAELFLFGGLLLYFLNKGDVIACILVFVSAAGSVLVSYIKARAESLGYECKVGLLSRVGRMVVLIPGLIFNIPLVSLWILAIFTHVTALQRFWHVHQQADPR
jgi:CDP-diacylglycerol--glycerol-3-phosphate 3-phosphatidyltransferase